MPYSPESQRSKPSSSKRFLISKDMRHINSSLGFIAVCKRDSDAFHRLASQNEQMHFNLHLLCVIETPQTSHGAVLHNEMCRRFVSDDGIDGTLLIFKSERALLRP